MQDYSNSKGLSNKSLVFFFILMVIAFLPVSSMQFFLKNDAFTGYFPPKFFMSESLHDGILPLWNPYINFGIPQYGDMSSGYWSPVTWLIAATVGYNAYSFTIELLLYIVVAGFGMYKLCRNYQMHVTVCVIAGASYMCCGYIVSHMQHFNWISGAAFLPLCAYAYRKLWRKVTLQNLIRAGIFFYLLVASAHPGIIIGSIYFFAVWGIFMWFSLTQVPFLKKVSDYFSAHLLFLFLLVILSAGLISGYLDILPHFTRMQKPGAADIMQPFSFPGFISFILPFSTTKNDAFFATDISMRNAYPGILVVIFFVVALVRQKTKEQWLLLGMAFFFLLLALGGTPGRILYELPMLGFVRLPGEYLIFSLFAIILFSSVALNRFVLGKFAQQTTVTILINFFLILLAVTFAFGLVMLLTSKNSILFNAAAVTEQAGLGNKLKWIVDNISFYDAIIVQSLVQFFVVLVMKRFLLQRNFNSLTYLVAAELALATLLNVPYTAAGQAPVGKVQEILNNSPEGIPIPQLQPIVTNDTANTQITSIVGSWSFYNKEPGNVNMAAYPIRLSSGDNIYAAYNKQYFKKPFVFIHGDSGNLTFTSYTGTELNLQTFTNKPDTLVIQQALYPHWFAVINDEVVNTFAFNQTYPGITLPQGKHEVSFTFKPALVKAMMLTSFVAFMVAIFIWIFIPFFPSWLQRRLRP